MENRPSPPRPRSLIWVEAVPPSQSKTKIAEKESERRNRRIVQSDAGRIVKEAAPDAFLGEKNRVVDRQTVSKETQMRQSPKVVSSASQPQPQNQAVEQKVNQKPQPKIGLGQLGVPVIPTQAKQLSQAQVMDRPEWSNYGQEAKDAIDGMKEGDRTALNTREYSYFGYHQRIRERLEREWKGLLRQALFKFLRDGRHLASDRDHVTRVVVTLNASGEIVRVRVLSESGVQELDDVAVNAFKKAGPFPNPPKGLIKDGLVEVPWELRLRS